MKRNIYAICAVFDTGESRKQLLLHGLAVSEAEAEGKATRRIKEDYPNAKVDCVLSLEINKGLIDEYYAQSE